MIMTRVARARVGLWVDRVASEDNIADIPTRPDKSERFALLRTLGVRCRLVQSARFVAQIRRELSALSASLAQGGVLLPTGASYYGISTPWRANIKSFFAQYDIAIDIATAAFSTAHGAVIVTLFSCQGKSVTSIVVALQNSKISAYACSHFVHLQS